MEFLSGAVIGELVARSISFLVGKYEKQRTTVQEDLQRLQHLLLRSGTIVEEAERRHVANRAMLQQLKLLRDETFRGHYVVDAVRFRALLAGGGGGGGGGRRKDSHADAGEEKEEGEESSRASALSRPSNPAAKRGRFPSGVSEAAAVCGGASPGDVQQMVLALEDTIDHMKEFVVLLMGYPPLYRQPYSVHLFMDKCMFGRHMEMERVMEFLLQAEPHGAANLGVLPIIGPPLVGKSTLVEHVCDDERVRGRFSMILKYTRNELNENETMAAFKDNCVIKHHNNGASNERLLIVIELSGDVGDETWNNLYSSERGMAQGSKVIVTSRSEKIARLGTAQALRLKILPTEAFWYFFKTLVFGSDDPGHHPKMASIAMELSHAIQGYFVYAHIGAALMRANFNAKSWLRVLTRLRQYQEKNVYMLGEEYPDDLKAGDQPQYTWSIFKQPALQYHILYDISPRGTEPEEAPETTFIDLLYGQPQPKGRNEILFWKSRIPPYFNYVCTCVTCDMSDMPTPAP
ncbi:hypothetical protein ACP70R_039561 [Stipagrostis hirtigluma subsp. patula]